MKSLFILLSTLSFSIIGYTQDNACGSSGLLQKAHLSCMSCALQKKNLPVPDDRFLASLGLVARENVNLLPLLAKSPFRLSLDSNRVQVAKNKDGSVFQKNSKEVTFTAENQYHNYVMEMILASGYCTKEKFKSASKEEKYSKFDERIKDEKFITGFSFTDPRTPAARELGANDWAELNDLFFVSKAKAGKMFPELTYAEQVSEMKKRRNDYLNKSRSSFASDFTSFSGKTEFYTSCFEELNKSSVSQEQLQNQSREICNAIYDECGIPRAGDPCGVKYPVAQESSRKTTPPADSQTGNDKNPPDSNPNRGRFFVRDGDPAPVEDRSTRDGVNTGNGTSMPYTDKKTIYQGKVDGCWYDSSNKKLNMPCNPPPASLQPSGNTNPPPAANK